MNNKSAIKMNKSDPILPGDVKCVVNGCKTRKFSKADNVTLFSVPQSLSDDWHRVIDRKQWTPKKSSKICSLHFTRGDVIGKHLRPGAIPLSSFPSLFVKSGERKTILILYKSDISDE